MWRCLTMAAVFLCSSSMFAALAAASESGNLDGQADSSSAGLNRDSPAAESIPVAWKLLVLAEQRQSALLMRAAAELLEGEQPYWSRVASQRAAEISAGQVERQARFPTNVELDGEELFQTHEVLKGNATMLKDRRLQSVANGNRKANSGGGGTSPAPPSYERGHSPEEIAAREQRHNDLRARYGQVGQTPWHDTPPQAISNDNRGRASAPRTSDARRAWVEQTERMLGVLHGRPVGRLGESNRVPPPAQSDQRHSAPAPIGTPWWGR